MLAVFKEAGLTQAEAADLIGVTRITFIRWLKNGPPSAAENDIKKAVVLVKAAMKLNLLPHGLPHARGNKTGREKAFHSIVAQTRQALEKYRAAKAAG